MDIKKAIELQREKMDHMAEYVDDLAELLEEARKMDHMIEQYEAQKTTV